MKSFKRVNNSQYEVAHNGQSVWNATLRRVTIIDEKVPVGWAVEVKGGILPVYFRDTPLGRSEMEAFKAKDVKYVVVAGHHKTDDLENLRYKEPNRLAVVEFDDNVDSSSVIPYKGQLEHKLMARIVRYAA